MSLAILFHCLCIQHVSDINISIIRSLRLCCWTTTLVVLFLVRCVLEIWCGCVWVLQVQHGYHSNPTTPKLQHTSNQEQYDQRDNSTAQSQAPDDGYIMSETYWAHKKWNKIASDIKLVFYSSTIAMMHGPINKRFFWFVIRCELLFLSGSELPQIFAILPI